LGLRVVCSDFKLIARGEAFDVHRCILAARSPVFAAMFRRWASVSFIARVLQLCGWVWFVNRLELPIMLPQLAFLLLSYRASCRSPPLGCCVRRLSLAADLLISHQ
jgi:hypothetical protein